MKFCFVPQNHWEKIKYLDFEVAEIRTQTNSTPISLGVSHYNLFFPWTPTNNNNFQHNPEFLGPKHHTTQSNTKHYPDMSVLKGKNISMKQATDKMYELLERAAKGEIFIGDNNSAIASRGAIFSPKFYLPYNNESGLGVDIRKEIEGL